MSLQPNSSSLHTGTCPTCPTCLTYPLSLQPVSSSEYHQCTYNPCTIEGCNTSDTSWSHPPCSSRDWMDGILEVGQNLVLDLSSIKDPHEFGRFGRYLSRSGCRNVIGHTRFLETRLPTKKKKTTYPIPSPTLGFKTPKKKIGHDHPSSISPKIVISHWKAKALCTGATLNTFQFFRRFWARERMMRDAMGKLHRDMDQWSSSKWLLCPRMQKKS